MALAYMESVDFHGIRVYQPLFQPIFTHSLSRMLATGGKEECNKNIEKFKELMGKLDYIRSEPLKKEAESLYALRALNYEVCNGGFAGYFRHQYHIKKPENKFHDIHEQSAFLAQVASLIKKFSVFRSRADELNDLVGMLEDIAESGYIKGLDYSECNRRWLDASDMVEWGMEVYASYLLTQIGLGGIKYWNT